MVISEMIKNLEKSLDRNEIFIILEYVLDKTKATILTELNYELKDSEKEKIMKIAQRRENKEPLQYIVHNQYFYGNKFYVDENVLIPRADTEILVEEVLKKLTAESKVLDLCTGSGCIAVSLKKAKNTIDVTASDISSNALTIAMINAKINNVNVNFVKSDLFANINQKYDIIVSNPPYIKKADMDCLQEEVKCEPALALDGGSDGLDFYKQIILNAKSYLNKNGAVALEIGYNQAEEVKNILEENNYKNIKIIKDYGNNDRVVIGTIL